MYGEDNLKKEDNLKNEDNHKNKEDLKIEDDLKNKEDLHIAGRHTARDIFRFAVFFFLNPLLSFLNRMVPYLYRALVEKALFIL